jgi:hypothetical protein
MGSPLASYQVFVRFGTVASTNDDAEAMNLIAEIHGLSRIRCEHICNGVLSSALSAFGQGLTFVLWAEIERRLRFGFLFTFWLRWLGRRRWFMMGLFAGCFVFRTQVEHGHSVVIMRLLTPNRLTVL